MSTILGLLGSIKLSLKQVVVAAIAAIIGGLVIALRVQGSQLHRLQTQLLELRFHTSMDQQDAKVEATKAAFEAAKKAYYDAGGQ